MGTKTILYFVASIFWITTWSIIDVDQIAIALDAKNNKISIENQNMEKVEKDIGGQNVVNDSFQINKTCSNEPYWDNASFYFDKEEKVLHIDFQDSSPSNFMVKNLNILLIPTQKYFLDSGYKLHNRKQIKVSVGSKKVSIPISIHKPSKDLSYSIDVVLVADGWDTPDGSTLGLGTYTPDCYRKKITTLTNKEIQEFPELEPFFVKNVFQPADITSPKIMEIGEYRYIDNFFEVLNLKLKNSTLPPVNEAALALLLHDVSDENRWESSIYYLDRVRRGKTVIGLFGNVQESDLELVSRMLTTLHIVAPNLDISYSDNAAEVNLPIHLVPCNSETSKYLSCLENSIGTYSPWDDWIWVDSNLKNNRRNHVLVHEIGHALGLNHNLCLNSSVSYAPYADEIAYFDHVDLMQLQFLYHPNGIISKIIEDDRKRVLGTNFYYTDDIIKYFNFSTKKLNAYNTDISSACSVRRAGYNYLIELQTGMDS